jgi:outer membrane protein
LRACCTRRPPKPSTSPNSTTKHSPATRHCKARAALAANSEELPLARAKLLPQVSASLNGSRQSTDFGGGFPASYGNTYGYVVSLTQPLIHVDSWYGYAQGKLAVASAQA